MMSKQDLWAVGLALIAFACRADEASAPGGGGGTTHGTTLTPDGLQLLDAAAEADWNADWPEGGFELPSAIAAKVRAMSGCVSVRLTGHAVEYERRSYDAALGLLKMVPVAADGSSIDSEDPSLSRAVFERWDERGLLLLRAGGGSGSRPYRHDLARDEHGNVTASLFFYGDELDLDSEPGGELYMATSTTPPGA